MEVTDYFRRNVLENPDRVGITQEMCEQIVANYEEWERQSSGRLRYWGRPEGRQLYLRVVVTEDGTALLNAFYDRGFTRKRRREEGAD
jgi:hypothetical protein